MSSSLKIRFYRPGFSSGKLVVAAMILIAAILAGITVWHHWSKGYASIAYWGATNGENIRYAPVVHLKTSGKTFDISQARGLVHFRQALIEDASFIGTTSQEATQPEWTHEVVFSWPEKSESTIVQFDLAKGLLSLPDQPSILVAKPEPTLSGLNTFFADVTSALDQ
ncbi:hypothetical protein Pan97_26690 [Bremerella volcania]|uniref:Uncharacterized protein n=1 Tax=Bremerella volcania TaxID=2527984 RepID=A0A518C8S7_9BACT|nr:hypothetical protein [Bremerella volcania]QDU75635.1 hypothetical protein Pan97_26690 [Bremerella volcania]